MTSILGIDIGGANLKAAHTDMAAMSVPFALWKNPQGLTAALRNLVAAMPPYDELAVTMTGELCDCFATRRHGVNAILDSADEVAGQNPVRVWSTQGRFLTIDETRKEPLTVAAANWLALATWTGRLVPDVNALLIDMGTTTTDILPVSHGRPIPKGRTDAQRLKSGELVYMGWRRTPVSAILDLSSGLVAEVFATTHDVHLLLELIGENEADLNTADGRPATRSCAHGRLARMLGEDAETVSLHETEELARRVFWTMETFLVESMHQVSETFPKRARPQAYVLAGSGEAIVRKLLGQPLQVPTVSLAERLGPAISEAACAYAVAVLASEEAH